MKNDRDRSLATLAQLSEFDEVIDARSPAEYAQDHIPGAASHPVLDDAQRAHIGTLYKQVSPFVAKRLGAAWVARNIANHVEFSFQNKGREWRPLVYCWRGGQRSGAFTHILRQIGWDAARLEGGYKAYRRHVVERIVALAPALDYRVVSGATGCGKSRLLEALAAAGAQVLDLEQLASHRGSLLGALPDAPQPSQTGFESKLVKALAAFDPAQPVFVEAESRKIGTIQVPGPLIEAMRASACIQITAPIEARVALLMQDYVWLTDGTGAIEDALLRLKPLYGAQTVGSWLALARSGDWHDLVRRLLDEHYDPLYQRSQARNYRDFRDAQPVHISSLTPDALNLAARTLLVDSGAT